MVPSDIQEGLQNLLSWSKKNRFFVSVSNKIGDSKVFINTIKNGNEYLIEEYFKGQGITSSIIESFGTDVLLLRKILMPGYRTPLIQYIENTRMSYFADNIIKKGQNHITIYELKYLFSCGKRVRKWPILQYL